MAKNKVSLWKEFRDIQRERLSEYLSHSIHLDNSVAMRLCDLSAALGCYQPEPECFVQAFKCKPKKTVYGIYHFRNRFFQLTCARDLLNYSLHQIRYRIFVHLYRRLFELEKDNGKRQLYLTLCYKLFDVDKPLVLTIQKNLKICEQFVDRLAGLIKMVSHYCKERTDLKKYEDNSKMKLQYFPIKIMKYAHRESYGYLYCYVKGLLWQNEFIFITDLPEQFIPHESVDYKILLEKQVLLSWNGNMDDLCLFYGAMPQQYKEYLRSYSQLMQYETDDDIYYPDSSSTVAVITHGNLWESREMILFLTDIIDQICTEFEIEEIAIEDSQSIASQDHQTESRRAQYVDEVVQTNEKHMWDNWLDELFDEDGRRIVIEELTQDQVSPSSGTLVFMLPEDTISEPEEEPLSEAEAILFELERCPELDKNFVLQEQENEGKQVLVTTMQLQSKPTLEVKPELVPKVELDRGLEPVSLQSILEPLAMCEHQRHIIVAPRVIIQSFKCNPSYQPSPHESDGLDFYEQLAQFIETMALHDIINIENIRERLAAVIRWNIGKLGQSSENCIKAMAKFQLGQLLTSQELETYKVMSWYHRDRGDNNHMTPLERRQDALHAMMGYECQQLMPSARCLRLVLRSPHYQESISESYLLLSLSQVGYFYRSLQNLRHKLTQLGEQGEALVPCVIREIIVLHDFYKQQQQAKSTPTLFHLYACTRSFKLHFQWMLQLCEALTGHNSRLLWTLHCQIGSNSAAGDELLQSWLLSASKPLLVRLGNWLLAGDLPQPKEHEEEFFIAEQEEIVEDFWLAKFNVISHRMPPFVSKKLAQLVLCVGRSHRYARQFLGIRLKCSLTAVQLQMQLSSACAECYRELNQQLLELLITRLQQETSSQLLDQLQVLRPVPLELLTRLHQYLLLSDTDFSRELIELLLPLLEQPVCCYNAQQLNDVMGQLLGCHNSQLYVDQSDAPEATHCWSCFLLRWKLPEHWRALLGHSLPQYAASFESLWQLHYVYYVLTERVQRQQSHFSERVGLKQFGDAREVRFRFEQFIDKLRGFIRTLHNYVLKDVLGSAFERLYMACKETKTVDEMLDLHSEYLHEIEFGIFQTKQARQSRFYLNKIYDIVLQLDTQQTKFLELCQLMVKYIRGLHSLEGATKRLQEFCWCCQSTCDILDDLDKQFQSSLVNFLLSLYSMGGKHWESLARKIDSDRFYANNFEQLKVVQTFRYQRKKKKQI